jgi:hypothetical protein
MERADQLEWLLGTSLTGAAQILCWGPLHELSPSHLGEWDRVRHDVWTVCLKLGIEDLRSAEREDVIGDLLRQARLDGKARSNPE